MENWGERIQSRNKGRPDHAHGKHSFVQEIFRRFFGDLGGQHLDRCLRGSDQQVGPQGVRRSNRNQYHSTLHPDDHRPRRPCVRSDLRLRHHSIRCRTVGTALDNLRHFPRGHYLGQAAADDCALFDYYELAHPEEGVGSGFKYKTLPHIYLAVPSQTTWTSTASGKSIRRNWNLCAPV